MPKLEQLTPEDLFRLQFIDAATLSPDGTRVVYQVRTIDREKDKYRSHLWMVPASGGEPRQLTHGEGKNTGAAWSPDGKWIAFLEGDEKKYGAYNMNHLAVVPSIGAAEGGAPRRMESVEALDRSVSSPGFSADGKFIRFLVTDDRSVYPAQATLAGGFTYGDYLRFVRSLPDHSHLTKTRIGQSDRGREHWELTITDPAVPGERKRTIFWHAREHAYETFSSFAMEGLVEYLLSEAGYRVARARDGSDLPRLEAGEPPVLVLLDMNLPGASGLDLVGWIRARPRLGGARIVALTAHAMRGDRERFLAAGCDDYISKPIEGRSFVAAVGRALGGDGGGEPRKGAA